MNTTNMGISANHRAGRRAASLLLALCLALCLLPATLAAPDAAPDDAVRTSLDKLVEWDVMRGDTDGSLHPDRSLTRAEFVALVNRAYGYTRMGDMPFTDVPGNAWYADDINIAYNEGYFQGTGGNRASPNSVLTRQEAVVLLARSLRLEQIPGQAVELSDGDEVADWSRGYIRAAARMGLIDDNDGKGFRPGDVMTRGEMADVLANAVGSLVQGGGEHSLGDVYGNVTINEAGTTLKDTVIAGDLYVTGGVGLGGVTLENATVLGKIVVAGGGEAEDGQESVVLRNVEAQGLVLDSLRGQYVSLRAEGDTSIKDATLRTSAFVQDRTDAGYGLLNLALDAAPGASFSLSGNLKDVVNKTPGSALTVSNGVAKSLTVDEKAVGSELTVGDGGVVRQLNLDAGTPVTGTGDIERLQVNTAGSSSEMLPDKIDVRPGLTADVAGEEMNSALAKESSSDPRLLAGYPKMKNVAPTSATAVFSANKAGTVHWAVSSVTDGSISEQELLEPKTYGSKALKQGSVAVKTSNTDTNVAISGLTKGGSYYLSAVMVDARGTRSPLKVVSFSTPDDTVPNFASGYPTLSKITNIAAQAAVMTTKDCILHYAVFPKGAAAPTANDFKTNSLSGNLGRGSREMTRNVAEYFYLNSRDLEELASYDAYFWLTDADGAKSSAVKKLSFSTVDRTPPVITSDLRIDTYKATSLGGAVTVNEDGTFYWAAVPAGSEYPKPVSGVSVALNSQAAKVAVAKGTNATKSGRVNVRADTQANVNISGLKSESAYDIYYVAQDKAGNYSEVVKVLLDEHTLDTTAPKASQRFDHFTEGDPTHPFADTGVDIIFTETVMEGASGKKLLDLYAAGDTGTLAEVLRNTILLYSAADSRNPVAERQYENGQPADGDDWVIDYRNAEVLMDPTDTEGRRMVVHFWGKSQDEHEPALNLRSGATYYFKLKGLTDTSARKNDMGETKLPQFTTTTAQVNIGPLNQTASLTDSSGSTILAATEIDLPFELTPQSTTTVESNVNWDLLLWSKSSVEFELYYKTPGGAWQRTIQNGKIISNGSAWNAVSFQKHLMGQPQFDPLNSLQEQPYQYVIHVTHLNGEPLNETSMQNELVQFKIQAVSGNQLHLDNQKLQNGALGNGVTDITDPRGGFELEKQFVDQAAPGFSPSFPKLVGNASDESKATIQVRLSDPGKLYYVIAPVGTIGTRDASGNEVAYDNAAVPLMTDDGMLDPAGVTFPLSYPTRYIFTDTDSYDGVPDVIVGSPWPRSVGTSTVDIHVNGLLPNTQYFAYFLIDGDNAMGEQVLLYRFETQDVVRPIIVLDNGANPTVGVTSNIAASVQGALITLDDKWLDDDLKAPFRTAITGYYEGSADDPSAYTVPPQYQTYFNTNSSTYLDEDYTVLDALKGDVNDGKKSLGSVFDLFADQHYKAEVARFIRASGDMPPEACAGTYQDNFSAGQHKTVRCGQSPFTMEPYPVTYCFLVVARSSGSGNTEDTSKDAFRATLPITKLTKQTPVIDSINAERLTLNESNNTVSGSFSLTFHDPLYFLGTIETVGYTGTKTVDMGPYSSSRRQTAGFVSIMALLDSCDTGITPEVSDADVNKSTRRVTFQVTNAPFGSSALFHSGFCDRTGTDVNHTALEIKITRDADGRPTITIPSNWNGTGHPEFEA